MPAEPKPTLRILKKASPDAALQLLGILQRDARLIDFAQEDLSAYTDADIGAAARVVHEGCRKVLRETEGSQITVRPGFDAAAIRLTSDLVGGRPPRLARNRRAPAQGGRRPCGISPVPLSRGV
jgi:hypothetical protein